MNSILPICVPMQMRFMDCPCKMMMKMRIVKLMSRVWLNSYMEENARSLVREINRNIRQTTLRDYNQLKVWNSMNTNTIKEIFERNGYS